MQNILLIPPLAFIIAFIVVRLFSRLTKGMAPEHVKTEGKDEPYACGEDFAGEKAEPEYKLFFPFAVFFTVLHVAGLMIATWAAVSGSNCCALGAIYVLSIAAALAILFVG